MDRQFTPPLKKGNIYFAIYFGAGRWVETNLMY